MKSVGQQLLSTPVSLLFIPFGLVVTKTIVGQQKSAALSSNSKGKQIVIFGMPQRHIQDLPNLVQ